MRGWDNYIYYFYLIKWVPVSQTVSKLQKLHSSEVFSMRCLMDHPILLPKMRHSNCPVTDFLHSQPLLELAFSLKDTHIFSSAPSDRCVFKGRMLKS